MSGVTVGKWCVHMIEGHSLTGCRVAKESEIQERDDITRYLQPSSEAAYEEKQ